MGTTKTVRTYELSEFPNTKANTAILRAEIAAAALASASIDNVYGVAGTVVCEFVGLLSPLDLAALDAVVAAHQGDDFAPTPVQAIANGEITDDTGTEVERLQLAVGPVPEGNYTLFASMQVAITTPGIGDVAEGRITVEQNGGSAIELTSEVEENGNFTRVGDSVPIAALAGDTFVVRALFKRTGPGPNPARCRRCRLFFARAS